MQNLALVIDDPNVSALIADLNGIGSVNAFETAKATRGLYGGSGPVPRHVRAISAHDLNLTGLELGESMHLTFILF
jgi:hypothetical protein